MATRPYCARCLTTFADDATHCPNMGCGAKRPAGGWPSVLGPGDHIDRHYLVERTLAVGGAGICYLARETDSNDQPNGPELAIKVLFDQRDSGPFLRRLANEAQILQELAHEHIVECRGFVSRTGHPPYLVTRFEHGGSLYDHIKDNGPQPPAIAAGTLRQILLALDVAHQRGVVHRDLKPQNVLLRLPTAQDQLPHTLVADFGIAKVQGGLGEGLTRVGGFVGTPEYAAPEQFAGATPTAATDLWAAGGVLWFLLTGSSPFRFSQRNDIGTCLDELLRQVPLALPQVGTPDETRLLQDVLDALLREDPEDRWNAWQVLSHLRELLGDIAIPEPRVGPTRAATPRMEAPSGEATYIDGGFGDADAPPASASRTLGGQGTLAPTIAGQARAIPKPAARPVPRPAAHAPPKAPPERSFVTLPDVPIRPSPNATTPAPRQRPPVDAPTPAPAPHRERGPNDLSLDDLFGPSAALDAPVADDGFVDAAFESEPSAPTSDTPPPPPSGRVSMRPPPRPAPAVAAPPTRPAALAPVDPDEVFHPWWPDAPVAVPSPLPADATRLLELLGAVHPDDRPAVLAALSVLPPAAIAASARSLRLGSPAAQSRGVALAIAALARVDLAPNARTLLSDPDPSVRICAAEAIAVVGRGAMLPPLQKLLTDPEPTVRSAAAASVARACRANERVDMGRKWLEALATDPNEDVRRAGRAALTLIDR